jgi:predicted nucleic acid-binding protein
VDAVLLDTCVLLKSYLCDTLLSIAEEGVYRPLWSEHVLVELRRNLVKAGAKQEAVEHRLTQMAAYFPDARVTSYEELIGSMTNHPKDRHVLAAAVAGRADILVTENLKDFPPLIGLFLRQSRPSSTFALSDADLTFRRAKDAASTSA